jgi:hypothetical protein
MDAMKTWWWIGLMLWLGGIILGGRLPRTVDEPSPALIELTDSEQGFLLQLARQQLQAVLAGEAEITVEPSDLTPDLKRKAACFVTLTEAGTLRGCMIDSLYPHEPIYQNVLRNTVLAATRDERFPPVTTDELDALRIEIGILDVPKPLSFESPEELALKLTPGVDGVILKTSSELATYLPQVWEVYPDPKDFLSHLCEKARTCSNCWQESPPPVIETYHVFHFFEPGLTY